MAGLSWMRWSDMLPGACTPSPLEHQSQPVVIFSARKCLPGFSSERSQPWRGRAGPGGDGAVTVRSCWARQSYNFKPSNWSSMVFTWLQCLLTVSTGITCSTQWIANIQTLRRAKLSHCNHPAANLTITRHLTINTASLIHPSQWCMQFLVQWNVRNPTGTVLARGEISTGHSHYSGAAPSHLDRPGLAAPLSTIHYQL